MNNKIIISFTDFIMLRGAKDIDRLKPVWEEMKRLDEENYKQQVEINTLRQEKNKLEDQLYRAEWDEEYSYYNDDIEYFSVRCHECEERYEHKEWCGHGQAFARMKGGGRCT